MTELDRYLDDFGERLEQAEASARHRGRRRAMWSATAVVACAAIAVALVLVTGGSSTQPVDAIAAARQAVTPSRGEIVYLRITSWPGLPTTPASVSPRHTTEQWVASGPSRWRIVQRITPYERVVQQGVRSRGREEFDYADGHEGYYSRARRVMTVTTGFALNGPASKVPSLFGVDPQLSFSKQLQAGEIRDLGIGSFRGREVRRLQRTYPDDGAGRSRRVLTYDVDPKTFAPVGGEWRVVFVRNGKAARTASGLTVQFVVDAYRRIPINEETAGLVRIRPAVGTRVVRYRVLKNDRGRTRIATCVVHRAGRVCRVPRAR